MGFSWNLWPWPWVSPVHMKQLRQRNYWEGNYRRVKRTLEAQEAFAASLYEENRTLKEQAAKLQKEKLAAAERSRRQEQLLLEARNEGSRKDEQHHQELNRLCTHLQALQAGPVGPTDDQVRERMRRLVFELDSWVRSNFRDRGRLASITDSEEFPCTSAQRRAWIHVHVVDLVHHLIFSPPRFGMNDPFGQCITNVEDSVKETSSQTVFQNWKMATGAALEQLTSEQQSGTLVYIIDQIERKLGRAASTGSVRRKQQLRVFLEHCVSFKNILVRQPDKFSFIRSQPGVDFVAGVMENFGGNGDNGNSVRLSLWPALVKHDGTAP